MNNNGLFISIEGPDCVGKSTVIREINNILTSQPNLFHEFNGFLFTREPGGSELAENLRNFILNSKALALDSITTSLLFIAARVDHLNKTILPALQQNQIVMVDRYVDSTAIYQGYLKGIDVDIIYELNQIATNGLMPELTFYLKTDAKTIFERSKTRAINQFDEVYLKNLEQMITGYNLLAEKFSSRIITIDANQTPETIAKHIIKLIQQHVSY